MLEAIRRRVSDMRRISQLSQMAETIAHDSGDDKPGAEHFLLAAFDLPDRTAQIVFDSLGVDRAAISAAIRAQYDRGLRQIGIEPSALDPDVMAGQAIHHRSPLYQAHPSAATLFKILYDKHQTMRTLPLSGALVVAAVAALERGVTARVFAELNLDRERIQVLALAAARAAASG